MNCKRADGVVLVVALLLTLMLSVLAAAFVLVTSSEVMIAENSATVRRRCMPRQAAAERAIGDLDALVNWTLALDGTARSTFVDGLPSGTRTLPGRLCPRPDPGKHPRELPQDNGVQCVGNECDHRPTVGIE